MARERCHSRDIKTFPSGNLRLIMVWAFQNAGSADGFGLG
jgi:hypothetical protein